MTSTTINDISDLVRILEEHPDWAETLRSLLLTREVLELPEKLVLLIQAQEATNARLDEFIRQQLEFNQLLAQGLKDTNAKLDEFIREQVEFNRQLVQGQQEANRQLAEGQQATNARLDQTNAKLDEFIQEQREINRQLAQGLRETNARLDQSIEELREFVRDQKEINRQLAEGLRETNARLDQSIEELRESVREQREINRQLAEGQQESNARLDRSIEELREANRQFAEGQKETNARLDQSIEELREANRQLALGQQETNARLDEFVRELRETNAKLDAFIREQRKINARADRRFARLEARTGFLLGDAFENRLHGYIIPLLAQRLGLRRPVIIKSRFHLMPQSFYDQLDAAEDNGIITAGQNIQVQQTDFILQARYRDTGEPVHLAVEVSRTVHEYDISRAHYRAAALAAVTGTAGAAVVIANFVPEAEEFRARDWEVTIVQEDEPEPEWDPLPEE